MNAATLSNYGYVDFTNQTAGHYEQNAEHSTAKVFQGVPSKPPSNYLPIFGPDGIADLAKIIVDSSASLSPSLHNRIEELSDLEANWDGEGAKLVTPRVIANVVEVLRRLSKLTSDFREPFLAPTFDGMIQIEWHGERRSLDVEAVSQGWAVVGTEIGTDGKRYYFTADCKHSEFAALKMIYDWFLCNELVWPQPSR